MSSIGPYVTFVLLVKSYSFSIVSFKGSKPLLVKSESVSKPTRGVNSTIFFKRNLNLLLATVSPYLTNFLNKNPILLPDSMTT